MDFSANKAIFLILFCVAVSASVAYYRYVVLENFSYFTTEEEIPDQFEKSTY